MWITAINKESNIRDRVGIMNYEEEFFNFHFVFRMGDSFMERVSGTFTSRVMQLCVFNIVFNH